MNTTWLKTCGVLVMTAVLAACGSSTTPQPADDEVFTPSDRSWQVETQATASGVKNGLNYLSDLEPISAYNEWGPVEKDQNAGFGAANDGKPIKLNGVTYQKGLGVWAFSEIQYALEGKCSSFSALVGLDDYIRYEGSVGRVVFRVYADGKKLFDSERLGIKAATKTVNVDVTDAKTLRLVVTGGGNGLYDDMADWADAKLECKVAGGTGTFTSLGSLQPPPNDGGYGFIKLADGRVLIAGGTGIVLSANSDSINAAQIYNPVTRQFTTTGSMLTGRTQFAGVLLQNGKVLVAGGRVGGSRSLGTVGTAQADLFDPATGSFTKTGSLNVSRAGPTGLLLPSGKVLVLGGWCNPIFDCRLADQAELYDPTTGQFSLLKGPSCQPSCQTATLLSNGEVLITALAAGGVPFAKRYNPVTDTTTLLPENDAFTGSAIAFPNGKIAFVNLFTSSGTAINLFDPQTNTFTATASYAQSGQIILSSGNRVFVFGQDVAFAYDAASNNFSGFAATPNFIPVGGATLNGGDMLIVGPPAERITNPLPNTAGLFSP